MFHILLMDPSPIVRTGIKTVLSDESEFQVIEHDCDFANASLAGSVQAIIAPCARLTERSFDAVNGLRQAGQAARVVAFSACRSACTPCRVDDHRLDAHLPPSSTPDLVMRTLRQVAHLAAPASSGAVPTGQRNHTCTLTPRERQVLGLMSRGMTNNEIAHALCLSEATIKAHLARTFRKLDATCRVTALVNAAHEGYLTLCGHGRRSMTVVAGTRDAPQG